MTPRHDQPGRVDKRSASTITTYERFSRSHHWLPTRPKAPPPPAASFAAACAAAIVRFWEIALAAGNLDPGREVVVLEAEAGDGGHTWQMLDALQQHMASSLCAGLRLRYIAATAVDADLLGRRLACRNHDGILETAAWRGGMPVGREGPLQLTGNPLVILAHRYFSGLTQDLFRRRRGHLFEGLLAQRHGGRLGYRWRGIHEADWLPTAWRGLLREDASPALFPSGALASLERLAELAGRRYLLLLADRDGAGLPRAWPDDRHLPVDLSRIAAHQAGLGAQVWEGWQAGGLKVQAILRDDGNPARPETLAAICAGLLSRLPDDHQHLAAIVRAARPQPLRVLALLRLSGFDPRVMQAGIDFLHDAATWDAALRRDWRAALVRVWSQHIAHAGHGDLGPRLADLAMDLGYWGLAKSVLRLESARRARPAACFMQLARCEEATGDSAAALARAEAARQLADTPVLRREAAALSQRLAARLRCIADLPWYRPEAASEGDLRAEPDLEQPGELILFHECWGRVGRAAVDLHGGTARFRLQEQNPDAEPLLRRLAQAAGMELVGWVERSETHHFHGSHP